VSVSVVVRRGTDRFLTRESGRQARHSFSFGAHLDPARTAFGPLVALNDELLGAGRGYDAHEHADVVLVTWVVHGALEHTGPDGTSIQSPGELAVTTAGTGITHSEVASGAATRFVQMWLRPDRPGGAARRDVSTPALPAGELVEVAGATELGVSDASLAIAALAPGDTVSLPDAPRVYAFVITGALVRSSMAEPLAAGDAFEITDEHRGGRARRDLSVTAAVPTQLLVWSFAR
jgi:redox-sensitive bicupin YhaK (pirin superfamily)